MIEKVEGIRAWYDKTTRKARVALVFSTIITAVLAVILFMVVPEKMILKAQIFNGAMVIPVAGGIWIAAFMFIWLIPMRELSFRGQESFERTEKRFKDAIEIDMKPAIETWHKIGRQIEKELNDEVMKDIRKTLSSLRETASRLEGKVNALENDIRPAADDVRRIAGRVDKEVDERFITSLKSAVNQVHAMSAPKGEPPSVNRALEIIRKKTENGAMKGISR